MRHPSLRLVAACAATALAVSACGADPDPREAATATSDTTAAGIDDTSPAPVGGAGVAVEPSPAPSPALGTGTVDPAPAPPVEVPETVEMARPDLVVRSGPMTSGDVYQAIGLPGVEQLAAASGFQADLQVGDRTRIVEALAVDPTTFRPMTPEVTAQTPAVWERLFEGDILVRHDIAHELGIELGGDVVLVGPTGSRTVRVGAFASNGAPPVADLIVPWSLGAELGAPGVNTLIIATSDDVDAGDTGERVAETVGGAEVDVLEEPVERSARIVSTGSVQIEPFRYTDLGDGMIVIDPDWVRRWIVVVDLPRVGRTRVHRIMAPQLYAAFEQIDAEGLLPHFKPEQFGGGWVPRHIDWNPSKPLSMHAWGLAIDLNTHDNWIGETPQMDPRVVEIFESWGFEWGGRWKRPDGMHFELDRVVEPSS